MLAYATRPKKDGQVPLPMMPERTQAESHAHEVEQAEENQRIVHGMQENSRIFMRYRGIAHEETYHAGHDDMTHEFGATKNAAPVPSAA